MSCWCGVWIAGAGPSRIWFRRSRNLQHLGVGFVSLTEALDLTTPAGRAMAGLLSVFAEFEREILRERVRAGLGPCAAERANASAARPRWFTKPSKARKLYRQGISKSEIARTASTSAEPPSAASWPKRNPDSGGLTQPCRKDTVGPLLWGCGLLRREISLDNVIGPLMAGKQVECKTVFLEQQGTNQIILELHAKANESTVGRGR